MRKSILFCCLLTGVYQVGFTQIGPPASQTITTGTVEALIESSGPLLTEFRIPGPTPGSTVRAFKDILLWAGGVDAAGNIHLALQNSDPNNSSFQGGFNGITNSAGVWKVTRHQIEQHLKDFADNGIIDNPIPAIFSWPGKGNPFSIDYNGFALDGVALEISAPYIETQNGPSTYNPSKGDWPYPCRPLMNFCRPADEIVYMPFFEKIVTVPGPVPFTPKLVSLNCSVLYSTYYCDDSQFLDNTIFAYVTYQMTDTMRLDSAFFSLVLNGDIGAANDDYIGTRPGGDQVYFYNGTENDATFGSNSPVVVLDLDYGPFDTSGIATDISSVMPMNYNNANLPAAMKMPAAPGEYYNYLTGSWRDGTPLTEGGNGYNPGNVNATRVKFPFPGNPADSNEWSEQSAGNTPGDRGALLNTGNITIKPGSFNRFGFKIEHIPGGTAIVDQVEEIHRYSDTYFYFFLADFFPPAVNPFDTLDCSAVNRINDPVAAVPVQVFPNPTRDAFTISIENQEITSFSMYNLLGQVVTIGTEQCAKGLSVKTGNLPAGVYWVSGFCKDGRQFIGKVIITH